MDNMWTFKEIITVNIKQYNLSDFHKYCKTFSTNEAAEEYILMNKPCLSYKDVEEITTDSSKMRIDLLRRLKKLVKSKM